MGYNIGVNLIETDGRASPGAIAAATSVTGFVIQSARGPVGTVEDVTSWSAFVERFGGHVSGLVGSYAVKGFFDNGGAFARVTRVVASDATPTTWNLGALMVSAASRGVSSPGAWAASHVKVRVSRPDASGLFTLWVLVDGKVAEEWKALSIVAGSARDCRKILNDRSAGSRYVMVTMANELPSVPSGQDTKDLSTNAGSDGSVTAADWTSAIDLFKRVSVQLLACPDAHDVPTIKAAIDHCALMGDRMFIGHTPVNTSAQSASSWAVTENLTAEKRHGALYFPWIKVVNSAGALELVPPDGHVAGVYARTERERGIWKSPAGNQATVSGAVDVESNLSDTEHTELVTAGSVNAVRALPGRGVVIDSARTLSTSPLWLYVGTRLLFNYVKSSLKQAVDWARYEPNDAVLWKKLEYGTIRPFLTGLWRRGAFGSGAPEDCFSVQINEGNNPPAAVAQGLLTIEVYFYPSRPAETIVLTIGQQDAATTVSER